MGIAVAFCGVFLAHQTEINGLDYEELRRRLEDDCETRQNGSVEKSETK